MTTISYKDMNLKVIYKDYDKFSLPETDTDTIIDDQTFSEDKRIFRPVTESMFKKIQLEFNSYLLPCNGGLYLSKFSSFDEPKLEKFRHYRMAKSNYTPKGKIDNYYKFFLLLNLMIKNKEIPHIEDTRKVYLDKYLKLLYDEKKNPTFNFEEMLSLNYYITQNFCSSPNLKTSTEVLEHMTVQLNNHKPLYRIYDMNLYIKNRADYINKYINKKCGYFDQRFFQYELKAPGIYTGFLKEEEFVINQTMFYDFNHFIFNEKAKIRNFCYLNLLKKLRECFTGGKYGFIQHGIYRNKKGRIYPLSMVREYSFQIKDKIPRYTIEELLRWFLRFYKYYNYAQSRFNFSLVTQTQTTSSDISSLYNPFKKYPKPDKIITDKLIWNCIYHIITKDECPYNVCQIYNFNTGKNKFIKYSDKIFNKNKFEFDLLYVNNKIGDGVFVDIFSKFNIKRNLKSDKLIMYRTDNFHVVSPTAKFLYHLYEAKRYELSMAEIIDMKFMGNDNAYKDRIFQWKEDDYLQIIGFSIIISNPMMNFYFKKIFDNHLKEYNTGHFLMYFKEGNSHHIHHYIKKFYTPHEMPNPYISKNMHEIFSMKNVQEYYNKYNQILVAYLQLNKDMLNNYIFYSFISSVKIPYIYPPEFYAYIHNIYKNNKFYKLYEDSFYEYYLYKRSIKHSLNNIRYTTENKITGKKLHLYNTDLLCYNMCLINLILFYGIKFPLAENANNYIPQSPYELFLCEYLVENFKYKTSINKMKTPLTETMFKNFANIYDIIYQENLPVYELMENYTKNKINKNELYPDINSYYENPLYDNTIYHLLYNYMPGKSKKLKTFYYENNYAKINSIEAFNEIFNNLNENDKINTYTQYINYTLGITYLKRNYNLFMQNKYENILPKNKIDTYHNDNEIIIQIGKKRYVFNKPPNPKPAFVLFLDENFVHKNHVFKLDSYVIDDFEFYCKEFSGDEAIILKYKEKEKNEFDDFKKKLFQWEEYGFYEITVG